MYAKQEIILKSYREGKSLRETSRELQISRKTVKKYVEENEAQQQLVRQRGVAESFSANLTTSRKYQQANRPKRCLTEKYRRLSIFIYQIMR